MLSTVKFENIPSELKAAAHWVNWGVVPDKMKMPINSRTDKKAAEADNESTWSTYDAAIIYAQAHNCGVGFEFGVEPSGFCGIDLDHVIKDGTLLPFAREIVDALDSYTEISPSGDGLHIFCKVASKIFPPDKDGSKVPGPVNGTHIELYEARHYFTVTGNVYETVKGVNERTEAVKALYTKYFDKSAQEAKPEQPAKSSKTLDTHDSVRITDRMTDSELWAVMFDSASGGKIRALFDGDFSGYPSQSEADIALCDYLAFFTGHDESRMDSMFRQSGLMREKWNEKHGAQTYGAMTISKALASVSEDYNTSQPNPTTQKTVQTSQTKEADSNHVGNSDSTNTETPAFDFTFNDEYLDGEFERDMSRYQKYANRKTGFENIDKCMSLYPGLYVIGAVPSAGKTTFALQLADQLSQSGEHVLFFALEQTRFELVSKSLARLTATEQNLKYSNALTVSEIKAWRITNELREAIGEYKNFSGHSQIIALDFETTINEVRDIVNLYIDRYQVKPVIFLDYLQLLKPLDMRGTTKDSVDTNILALKKLQKDSDLLVFIISSLNRANYLNTIDFESFKESGGIEYTADSVWGLQLSCVHNDAFKTDKGINSKRDIIRRAKAENPRKMELCILKNRYGGLDTTFLFDYFPGHELFISTGIRDDKSNYNTKSARL